MILHEIRSPDMSGKGFALSWETKEKVLRRLFPFCMGDLSDLLTLCLLSPHASVYSAIRPFSSTPLYRHLQRRGLVCMPVLVCMDSPLPLTGNEYLETGDENTGFSWRASVCQLHALCKD